MKRRKLIIVVVVAIGLLLVGIGLASRQTEPKIDEETGQLQKPVVEVSGASDKTRLDITDDEVVQKAIGDMVYANEDKTTRDFTAEVRQDSIQRGTTSYGTPKVQYLVDIPKLKRTFVVQREGDASSEFASIYVTCPTEADLKYPAKKCQEIE
jgi:hypothetical protein